MGVACRQSRTLNLHRSLAAENQLSIIRLGNVLSGVGNLSVDRGLDVVFDAQGL